MEPTTAPAGQLVVASDIRNTLFRRALVLLDEVHAGLEDFSFGGVQPEDGPQPTNANLAIVAARPGASLETSHVGALVPHTGGDTVELALANFVQGRTNTARRAVDAVAQIHSEIDNILSSFERQFPPMPSGLGVGGRLPEVTFEGVHGEPSEEVLRMAAATTAAAARFRVRAAESAKTALQVYDSATKQAATAAQATTKALEMQVVAERHSIAGNLPQALDAIRQANRLRDESNETAQHSRHLQQQYMRHRKEAQEAHAQADAAMRHAYSLERDALRSSRDAAARQHAISKDRYDRLAQQAEDLRAQAAACDAEADAATARAEQAQQQADMQMAAGNYELGNALVGEAVRSKEEAGYARAQAAAAREALQRLMPDVQSAREHMEEAEQHLQELIQRQAHLQDATTKQRKDRLQEEATELASLYSAAEGAAAMHEQLVRVYEDRLTQDQEQYDALLREGRTAEADALAVHISTFQDLLEAARQNYEKSRAEADAVKARLEELSKMDENPEIAFAEDPPEDFQQLRDAKDKGARAAQAVTFLARELASMPIPDIALEGAGTANDALLLQTELHHQRIARLAQQMHTELRRIEDGAAFSPGDGQSGNAQADALLDSMAVSHLVGTLETTRLLQLWKQRSEQAAASAEEMREKWMALDEEATTKAEAAKQLKEQAMELEQAGRVDEAAAAMVQAEDLHRMAEQLRQEADKAKAVLIVREKAAGDAQTQTRYLVQGLHDVEQAAERLQSELGLRGYNPGAQEGGDMSSGPLLTAAASPGGHTLPQPADGPVRLDGAVITDDEMATVMMASPCMLSRSSSATALCVQPPLGITSMDLDRRRDAGNTGGGVGGLDSLDKTMPAPFWGTASSDQLLSREGDKAKAPPGPWMALGTNMHRPTLIVDGADSSQQQISTSPVGRVEERDAQLARVTDAHRPALTLDGANSSQQQISASNADKIQERDALLARLMHELESHATVNVPAMPDYRWDSHAALAAALQAGMLDEAALATVGSTSAILNEQARDGASTAELQLQRDAARKSRWEEVVATLPPGLDASVAQAADRASSRCSAVAAASSLTEDAMMLQASCHDALASSVGSLRRALSGQRTAEEGVRVTLAEAASLQLQARESEGSDENLLQQIQQLENQLEALEAQGAMGKALTTRYELQRLQNKHAEAAAQATQLQTVYEAACQRADEARMKEAEVKTNVQTLHKVTANLADAANEAGTAVQCAVDGYNHAVSALALGAQVDLARILLGSGDAGSADVAEAEVQRHLDTSSDRTNQAQERLATTRRLQELLASGTSGEWAHLTALEQEACGGPPRDLGARDASDLAVHGAHIPGSIPSEADASSTDQAYPGAPGAMADADLSSSTASRLARPPSGLQLQQQPFRGTQGTSSPDIVPEPIVSPGGQASSTVPSKHSKGVEDGAASGAAGVSSSDASGRTGIPGERSYSLRDGVERTCDHQVSGGLHAASSPASAPSLTSLGSSSYAADARQHGVALPASFAKGARQNETEGQAAALSTRGLLSVSSLLSSGSAIASESFKAMRLLSSAPSSQRDALATASLDPAASRGPTPLSNSSTPPAPFASASGEVELPAPGVRAPHLGVSSSVAMQSSVTAGGRSGADNKQQAASLSALFGGGREPFGGALGGPPGAPTPFGAAHGLLEGPLGPLGGTSSQPSSTLEPLVTTPVAFGSAMEPLDDAPTLPGSMPGPLGGAPWVPGLRVGAPTGGASEGAVGARGSSGGAAGATDGAPWLLRGPAGAFGGKPEPLGSPSAFFCPVPTQPGEASHGQSSSQSVVSLPVRYAKAAQLGSGVSLGSSDSEASSTSYEKHSRTVHTSDGSWATAMHPSSSTAPASPSVPSAKGPSAPSGLQTFRAAMDDGVKGFGSHMPTGYTGVALAAAVPSGANRAAGSPVQAVREIEAELASLEARRRRQLEQMRLSASSGNADIQEMDRLTVKRELEAQLREAEQQLHAVRVEEASLRDASPAEVQACHDKLQYHEHRVAMLQQALKACDEVVTSRGAVGRTREAISAAELEAQHYDETLALLSKAAEMCGAAVKEMQAQALDDRDQADVDLQQRLAFVQQNEADITQRRQLAQRTATSAYERRNQLLEQLAADESAVQLREDWLQQARRAASAASATLTWEERLNAARAELQKLEAPYHELKDKAKAASNLAQTMTTAAAQHRKQAGDLSRQAADQREDARRLAASGRQLEADAAHAMADSLQQQADGLLAEATQMEDDARKLKSESRELTDAADHARDRAAALAEVIEQVSAAHQLSMNTFQLNRTAAMKLHDAKRKQAVAAQQQLELAKAEKELASMEAQMSGSGGGALRPDELASHMINVVRAKQQASQMRAALRAVQQQLDEDRDAASSAARQAAKAEGQCAQLEPKIKELERQVLAAASAGTSPRAFMAHSDQEAGDPTVMGTAREVTASPATRKPAQPIAALELSGAVPGGSSAAKAAGGQQCPVVSIPSFSGDSGVDQPSGFPTVRPPASGGVHAPGSARSQEQSSNNHQTSSSVLSGPLSHAGRAVQREWVQQPQRLSDVKPSVEFTTGATEQPPHKRAALIDAGGRLQRTDSRGFSQTSDDSAAASVPNSPRAKLGRRDPAYGTAVTSPLGRGRLDVKSEAARPRDSMSLDADAPSTNGLSAQQTPRGSPRVPASFAPIRIGSKDLLTDDVASQQSSPSARHHDRNLRAAHFLTERENSWLSQSNLMPGSPKSPQRPYEQTPVTADALFDKVAGKSLRPLSNLVVNRQVAGQPASAQGPAGASRVPYGGHMDPSASDPGHDSNRSQDSEDVCSIKDDGDEENTHEEEDDGVEPDSKMYRTMRQRLTDIEARIVVLRRQGGTASTAVELLARKQEQLRPGTDANTGVDDDRQALMLEHIDVISQLKGTEAALCLKQADLLEDEATVCRDAIKLAEVDWHLRRELTRLEGRCGILDGKAHAGAMAAQTFDAEAADAMEGVMLATSRADRQSRSYMATFEQRSLTVYIEEQQERLRVAKKRAADSRLEAAQFATKAKEATARKALFLKKLECNKGLYDSSVELADAFEDCVKLAARGQHYQLLGFQCRADALGARLQQMEGVGGAVDSPHAGAQPPAKGRIALIAQHSSQRAPEALKAIASMAGDVASTVQHCLQELLGETSEAFSVVRRQMGQISTLVDTYHDSLEAGDHLADSVGVLAEGNATQPQEAAPSDLSRRAARVVEQQNVVRDLDRACVFARDLRAICLETAETHAALFDVRADLDVARADLVGQHASTFAFGQEELDKLTRRLGSLNVEVSLARDQLNVALQTVDYKQAAAQLMAAQRDLQHASNVARDAVAGLELEVSVHHEGLDIIRSQLNTIALEARTFKAAGNVLQAAAAEEAAQRLAQEVLDAEKPLAAMEQEVQLKRDEQLAAGSAAEELLQVAEGSTELAEILARIVELQQEARVASRRAKEAQDETLRFEGEAKSEQRLAESLLKQADLLQHESLQCRTNLKFVDADARLHEARQCRANAQEQTSAANAAKQSAAVAAREHQTLAQRQQLLLREVQFLHTAAGHLQETLSSMRSKHHLLRRLRDVEYQLKHSQPPTEAVEGPSVAKIAERDVLLTQVAASNTTIQHHLSSKASYIKAADNLHLSVVSLQRAAQCAKQAESAMQDLMNARLATAGTCPRSGTSVPLLTSGRGNEGHTTLAVQVLNPNLSLTRHSAQEGQEDLWELAAGAAASGHAALVSTDSARGQLQQVELRYRCLRGSISVLEAVTVAAERASQARHRQVELSDQAASMLSDLAAKILEAEANADEAARLEAAMRAGAKGVDDEDEAGLKLKLMVNALLQKAEAHRGEAAALQGRIKELEQQQRVADADALELEAALGRLQADYRYTLEALELTERLGQYRKQEAQLRSQAVVLSAEIAQLDREAQGMEDKSAQLRQQLTHASHTACSEDVANLMLVMQQMASKASVHRQQQQQRRAELEANEAEAQRVAGEVVVLMQRADHVLHASETQELVRQASERIAQLQTDLASAESAQKQCSRMLDELRQQYEQLSLLQDPAASDAQREGFSTALLSSARQPQQIATTQAAIALGEQMLETHNQRVGVLQAAVEAWEVAKQRYDALLRHQGQLMQQAEWSVRLGQYQRELRACAAEHAGKARQLRTGAKKGNSGSSIVLAAQPDWHERLRHGTTELAVLDAVRSQVDAIKAASQAAHQHTLAEAEDALASRATALAAEVGRQVDRMSASAEVVRPMYQRLVLVASTSMSVARLQLACVGVSSDQGSELTTVHDALSSVRSFAGRIQSLLEAADRHMCAGNSMEAAAARGQATAVQEALQQDLKLVRSCRQHLTELDARMQDAKQELLLAGSRMAQVSRSAAVVQSVTEYTHRACELYFQCGERQRSALRVVRLAAEAVEKAEATRRELKATKDAIAQLSQAKKADPPTVLQQAVLALERGLTESEAKRRLLEAQAVQQTDTCTSETAAAGLYSHLAGLSIKLLRHMDELESHKEGHDKLDEDLDGLRRNLEQTKALLRQRREEMGSLTGQIEAHKVEAHLLQKMGNEAQACVRNDAAGMMTGLLAEIAENVMHLEFRCSSLEQRQVVASSILAKSEARMGLLRHLARLCSASVSHLLDARDAHDSHTTYMRDAAVAAVEHSKAEAALAEADKRLVGLRESSSRLQRSNQVAVDQGTVAAEDGGHRDPDQLLRAASFAQAELSLAQRRRLTTEQQVAAARIQSAQAEVALQSSQLRITKARQRAEDAERLVDSIVSLLEGSKALDAALQPPRSTRCSAVLAAPEDATQQGPGGIQASDVDDLSHCHGTLAAAQLHSVVLQALAESASKLIQALDMAAAAESARGSALSSIQKAQAAREAAGRQNTVVEDLRAAAEGASVAQQVQRFHSHRLVGDERPGSWSSFGSGGGAACSSMRGMSWAASPDAVGAATAAAAGATAVVEVELERLQHEAAYLEATAAQEKKLVACLAHQDRLLRQASKSLLDMARFGVAAEQNASPSMTADEAASLLAACKQLSQQHAATLMLAPCLDCGKQAEACLQASLESIQEAWRIRQQVLDCRLVALSGPSLDGGQADKLGGGLSMSKAAVASRRVLESRAQPATAADKGEALPAALLDGYKQLLSEEERVLHQVQQLDDNATQLLRESSTQSAAFDGRWAEIGHPVQFAAPPARRDEGSTGRHAAQQAPLVVSPRRADGQVEGDYRGPGLDRAAGTLRDLLATSVAMLGEVPAAWRQQEDEEGPRTSSNEGLWGSQAVASSSGPALMLAAAGRPDPSGSCNAHSELAPPELLVLPQPVDARAPAESLGDDGRTPAARPAVGDAVNIDADLVAMAAATVARAKAAAAALAARSSNTHTEGQLSWDEHSNFRQAGERDASSAGAVQGNQDGATPADKRAIPLPERGSSTAPSSGAAVESTPKSRSPLGGRRAKVLPAVSVERDPSAAMAPSEPQVVLSGTDPRAPAANGGNRSPTGSKGARWALGSAFGSGPHHSKTSLAAAGVHSSSRLAGQGQERHASRPGAAAVLSTLSTSTFPPPSSSECYSDYSALPRDISAFLDHQVPGLRGNSPDASRSKPPEQQPSASSSRPQAPAKISANGAVRPLAPILPRLALPKDLDATAVSELMALWSTAAGHYERIQHMHDSAMQHIDRQWQRCQAQLQMLQAEELQARAERRAAEADAVAAAAAKWKRRAGHLEAAMRRHSAELGLYKAMTHRAVGMAERLQLVAGAAASANGDAIHDGGGIPAEANALLQHLVPRMPASTLAGCGVVQSLEKLHGELVQQVAALQAAAAGLKQQSQRLFAKVSRRSGKLKASIGVMEDTAAHALTAAKSQLVAEQSAAMGERAVELATQARLLQQIGERLSTEGSHCFQALDRLQRASEQELKAQHALVQTVDLLLCDAMLAILLGQGDRPAAVAGGEELSRAEATELSGDFDSLLKARHPHSVCVLAACRHARLGEDLAKETARTVQGAKEELDRRAGLFPRGVEEAAEVLFSMASQRAKQHESLLAQVDAAALCVARARSKTVAQRSAGDVAAADKYNRAADGWAKQLEKLRREAAVASAAAEDLASRAEALASLGAQLRPMQAALDGYLDQQLEAWASAALSQVQARAVAV